MPRRCGGLARTCLVARTAALVDGGARGVRMIRGREELMFRAKAESVVMFGSVDCSRSAGSRLSTPGPPPICLSRVHHYKDKSA
jgi:hypothetical protein